MLANGFASRQAVGIQGHGEPNRELLGAALCRTLVPEGSVEGFLADHRQELFPNELFVDLFASGRGRPSVPADVIATVMVLQALEGLSDCDAARALRDRISWKVARRPAHRSIRATFDSGCSCSRSSGSTFTIKAFSVIMAEVLAFTAVSLATLI